MKVPPFNATAAGDFRNTDHLSSQGVQVLCRRIEAAWRQAGHHDVRAWPERISAKDGLAYAVRSNLVGALPPSAAQRMAA